MRDINRIDGFIEVIFPRLEELFENIWEIEITTEDIDTVRKNKDLIVETWKNYPYLRFSQILITLDYIPNYPGFWFYKEENEILNELL